MSSSDEDAPSAGLGSKRGKRGRGDDAYLGVFAEGDSSEGEGAKRDHKRDNKRDKQPLSANPVTFAKASAPSAPARQAAPPAPAAAGGGSGSRGILGSGSGGGSRGGLGAGAGAGGSRGGLGSAPVPGEKVDKDFGTFEVHSKGIGSKLLAKMGWKAGMGLGKGGIGVVNPLEQKLRPNSMGLGYGGFKEVTAKAKMQQSRILHGDSLPEEDAAAAEQAAGGRPGGRADKDQSWRKGERRTLKVRTATELMEEWDAAAKAQAASGAGGGVGGASSATVLDMRGPQARVHASLADVDTSSMPFGDGDTATPTPTILPELKHNVRMLVDLAEVGLQQRYRKLRGEKESVALYRERAEAHDKAAAQTTARLQSLEEVRAALGRCVDGAASIRRRIRVAGASGSGAAARGDAAADGGGAAGEADSALAEWAGLWDALRRAHPAEWAAYALYDAAIALAMPIFRAHLAGWKPLRQPRRGVRLFAAWERALCSGANGTVEGRGAQEAFGALVYTVVLPPLRSALANEWSARDAGSATALLAAWRPLLPPVLLLEMVEGQIVPRLLKEISAWSSPRAAAAAAPVDPSDALDVWLRPWAVLLPPPGLPLLFPQIRHRLASALAEWPPLDEPAGICALQMLAPWRELLDAQSWCGLVVRSVLPKLEQALEALEVNPAEQDILPIRAVLAWSQLVPTELLSQLLLRHLFPSWLHTLHEWLAQAPELAEVAHWYGGWKELLRKGAPALLRDAAVLEMLNRALDLLNAALASELPPLPPQPHTAGKIARMVGGAAPAAAPDWGRGTEEDRPPPPPPAEEGDSTATQGGGVGRDPVRVRADGEATLREVLEQLADSQGRIFMPLSTRHEGKQVFSFGGVSLYLDNDKQLVYARHAVGSKGFVSTSLQQLVTLAAERGGAQ